MTYSDENMIAMARSAIASGTDRSSFAQCAEWAHDEASKEARGQGSEAAAKLLLSMLHSGDFKWIGGSIEPGDDTDTRVEKWLSEVAGIDEDES